MAVPLTDAALIVRVVTDDDRHAFAELVRRHQSSVRGLLRRLCAGDDARADDLAQETFHRAWRGLAGFRGASAQADATQRVSRFSTWLHRVAYRVFVSDGRRTTEAPSADGRTEPADDSLAAASPAERAMWRYDLSRALARLRPEEHAALALTYGRDLSHEEAAAILDCPLGSVKTWVLRAKEKLRRELRPPAIEVSP